MTLSAKLAPALLAAGLSLPATGALAEAKLPQMIDKAEEKAETTTVAAETTETTEKEERSESVEVTRAETEPMDRERTREVLGAEPTGMFFAEEESRVTVADMMHRTVVSTEGEPLGDITRVVENGDTRFFVVEHGGFLGIGDKEVAIPVARTALLGEAVVVSGMSEEELDALPDYDADAEVTLNVNHAIDIRQAKAEAKSKD